MALLAISDVGACMAAGLQPGARSLRSFPTIFCLLAVAVVPLQSSLANAVEATPAGSEPKSVEINGRGRIATAGIDSAMNVLNGIASTKGAPARQREALVQVHDHTKRDVYSVNAAAREDPREKAAPVAIYGYYNLAEGDHVYTTSEYPEDDSWEPLGIEFYVYPTMESEEQLGTVAIYCYYNSLRNDHEYTTRSTPYDSTWVQRGTAFYAFADATHSGLHPVYAYYNGPQSDHEYTLRSTAHDDTWDAQGIAFYAFKEKAPVKEEKKLIRKEMGPDKSGASGIDAIKELEANEFDGVTANACKNYDATGKHKAQVSCPAPLKMSGCSCRDKIPEKTGACSTEFKSGETCAAYTLPHANVTAYVRCCNFKHYFNGSVMESQLSGGNDGDGVHASCPAGHTLLGCACVTGDRSAGCKMTRVTPVGGGDGNGSTSDAWCEATNYNPPLLPHLAGVKAQALCAMLPESKDWETATMDHHTQAPENMSTGLACSDTTSEMISCSCSSSSGECGGGKVLGGKCECFGWRCLASARCAKCPVPPIDCTWTDWGEWSACGVSCGAGTKSRVREVAMVAQFGGEECKGVASHIFDCEGDATEAECALKIRTKSEHDGGSNDKAMMAGAVCVVLVLALAAGLYYHYGKSQAKLSKEKALYGEGEGDHQYGEYGGYDEDGGEQQGEGLTGGEDEAGGEEANAEEAPGSY